MFRPGLRSLSTACEPRIRGSNATYGTASVVLTTIDKDLALTGTPTSITTPATGRAGAVVTYTPPTATDEVGDSGTPTVVCLPASGSTFAIGMTTVTCTATDSDDSNSPVKAQFTVTVQGALTQLQALLAYITTLPASTAKTVLAIQVQDAITASENGNSARVCLDLAGIVRTAQQERSYGQLTTTQATQVITAADQIAAVTGCGQTSFVHRARPSRRNTHAHRKRPKAT
jgi:HYR domain